MPIRVKTNGAQHTVTRPYVKVSGSWRSVNKVQNKISGSWRTSFEYITYYNLYFYEEGSLVSTKTVQKGSSIILPTISEIIQTEIPGGGDSKTTVDTAGWYSSGSSSKPTTSGSSNFATYSEGATITPTGNMYFHAVYKYTTTTSGTTTEKGEQKTVESSHPSDWTGWNKVTESVSVSDAYPGSSYSVVRYYKLPSQYLYWTEYTSFAEGTYGKYPTACYFRFRNYGASVPDTWSTSTLKSGTAPTSGAISASYTCSSSASLKNGCTTTEANRYLYDKNYTQVRAGLNEHLNYVTYYERVVLKITYYPIVVSSWTKQDIKYCC